MTELTAKEFHERLHKYSTAYSPLYKTYVGIISVYGIVGDEKIRARLAGAPEGEYITFRPSELTDYCL